MIEILNRFLIQNKSISIPGLGTIHAQRVSAAADAELSVINAPYYTYRFDKYFDAPDKAFFTYLSTHKQIPDFEAIRLFNQFAQDFRSTIRLEEKSTWKDIGYFQKNQSGEIEFFPLPDESGLQLEAVDLPGKLPSAVSTVEQGIPVPPILRDKSRPVPVGVLIAAIIALASLVILSLHFNKHGFNWKAVANQQSLELKP